MTPKSTPTALTPTRRLRIGGAAALVAAALAIATAVGLRHVAHPAAAQPARGPDYGSAPAYMLTDQWGRRVDSRQFAGKVQVVSYLFPYCTTYCPLIARNLVLLRQQLQQRGLSDRVQLVAFNVDPGGAGPAQLRAFWSEFGGDPADPGFAFLTGSPEQIHTVVADGFHVDYQKVAGADGGSDTATPTPTQRNPLARQAHVDYDIQHNDFIEIVGPRGHIRQIFDSGSLAEPADLMRAVHAAMR